MNQTVTIICDANDSTGLGHLLRCISLAQGLQQIRIESLFMGDFGIQAQELIRYFGFTCINQTATVSGWLQTLTVTSPIVIDRYDCHEQAIVGFSNVLLIDDFCQLQRYHVKGVINFTLEANQYDYVHKGAASQALGIQYFLKHPSLSLAKKPFTKQVKRVLILIGSGDKYFLAPLFVKALQSINSSLEVKVVGLRKHYQHSQVKPNTNHPYCVNLLGRHMSFIKPTPDIDSLYEWADFCITSGGLAKYECAYLQMPSSAVALTSQESKENREFSGKNLTFDLGFYQTGSVFKWQLRLQRVLGSFRLRKQAYQACKEAFQANSQLRAAKYVRDCLFGE